MEQGPAGTEATAGEEEAQLEQLEALQIVEPVTSFEAKTGVPGARSTHFNHIILIH